VLFDQNDEGLVKGLNGNYGSSGQVDYIEMTGNKIVPTEWYFFLFYFRIVPTMWCFFISF
jgi:hypothetical protein